MDGMAFCLWIVGIGGLFGRSAPKSLYSYAYFTSRYSSPTANTHVA
jgi:hypothetical protein